MTSWKEIRMKVLRTKTGFNLLLIGIYCVNCVLAHHLISLEFGGGGIGFNFFTLGILLGGGILMYGEIYVFFVILDFLGNPIAPYALYTLSCISGRRNGFEHDPEEFELLAKKYNERRIGKYADWRKWDYTATPEEIEAYKLRKQKRSDEEQKRELKIQADNEQVNRMMKAFGLAYLIMFILGVVGLLLLWFLR